MTTAVLRPNATPDAPASVTGAVSAHVATNDDSDASYYTDNATTVLEFGTFTLPAGAVTKQVRFRHRGRMVSVSPGQINYRIETDLSFSHSGSMSMTTTTAERSGAYKPGALIQPEIDALRVHVDAVDIGVDGTLDDYQAMELYVDVVHVILPVVAVTAVAPDPYTASSVFPIAWTNTLDGDGGGQTYFQLKIFTAAQYGAGGFDPATSLNKYDSGEVASSATSTASPPLANDTYRAYVRVAQTVNGVKHWSAYAFDQFTVTVPDAEVDTVTMIVDNPNGSIEVTVARDTLTEAWEYAEVQRSFDAGSTWEYVRGAAYVDATGNADTFVVDDYEVGNAQSVKYRARATRIVATLPIVSPWVESASTTSWSSTDTWLKDPFDPSKNLTVCMRLAPSSDRQRRRGVFDVIGSAYPVVVSVVLSGFTTEFEVQATTIAETAAVLELATSAGVLLLQTPPTMPDGSRYLHVGGVGRSPYDPSRIRPRQWVALTGAVEVESPADPSAGI